MTNKFIEREQVIDNGFDLPALSGLYGTLKDHPEGGKITFSTNTRWQDGARAFTSIRGYKVDGDLLHDQERQFVMLSDEPSEFGASDVTLGPVEALMYAVASCVTATTAAYATLKGVKLTQLEVSIDSDVDLQGMFGLDNNTRPGIGDLRIQMRINGDADQETLRELARLGYTFSPVRDSVDRGVPFTANVKVGSG